MMKRQYLKLMWVGAQFVVLSACDRSAYQSGIEGSGITTNAIAGVPAITTSGEVTALGSIVVNGVTYALTGATITIDGIVAGESDLAPGQVAVVEGGLTVGATRGLARRVTIETSVAGPISAIDTTLGRLTILRQTIALDPGTIVADGIDGSSLRGLDVGRDVQVSGFADSTGVIHATRIEPRKASTPWLVTGRVANLDTSASTFSVNEQLVSYAGATVRAVPAEGMSVRVTARTLARDTLVADEVSHRPDGLPGQVGAAAVLHGWVTRVASQTDFDVDGRRVLVSSNQGANVVRLDAFLVVRGALTVEGALAATEVGAILPGRIVGRVTIEGVEHGISGVMTDEGVFRLNIEEVSSASPASDSGVGQLVGTFTVDGRTTTGTGVLIGEGCALPSAGQFCGTATAVRIEVAKVGGSYDLGSAGAVRVATANGEAVWPLRLGYWGGRPGFEQSHFDKRGVYELHQAEFAQASPVFMTVYDDGHAFFESTETGCTGIATISNPRHANLYDVEFALTGCDGSFGYLNGPFDGFATRESFTPWDYDYSVFRLWVSRPVGAPAPAAVTLWGELK